MSSTPPSGLKESGEALWEDTVNGRQLSAAHKALLLNACRIADRLDDIAEELEDAPLTVTLYDKRGEPINEVAQPLLGEHRQQFATMSQILSRLGVGELPKTNAGKKSLKDQLAEQREKREAKKSTA